MGGAVWARVVVAAAVLWVGAVVAVSQTGLLLMRRTLGATGEPGPANPRWTYPRCGTPDAELGANFTFNLIERQDTEFFAVDESSVTVLQSGFYRVQYGINFGRYNPTTGSGANRQLVLSRCVRARGASAPRALHARRRAV